MEFFTIGSGSSGNCSFLGSGDTTVLFDAGISGKRTIAALSEHDVALSDLKGIFITHEHRDHIGCLGVLLRKCPIPVYATEKTIDAILSSSIIGDVDRELFVPIEKGRDFVLGDLRIRPLSIKHDAADPVGYRIEDGKSSMALVTDLGTYDNELITALSGLDGILIESNHDIRMLETGIYPYHLKKRIASEYGHLSNEDCGRLISELLHDDMKWIMLGHLSAENNYDRLAFESVGLEISLSDNKYRAGDFPMYIAHRDKAFTRLSL